MNNSAGVKVSSRVWLKNILHAPPGAYRNLLWRAAPAVWEHANTFVYGGVAILANLLAGRNTPVNGMYLEFANTTTPGSIVPPEIDLAAGTEYYRSLSGGKDYLRVTAAPDPAVASSGDPYPGNRVTFMGFSGGASAGGNGTSFSSAASSCVYGAALVHLAADPANDIVFGRVYADASVPLAENQQTGVRWATTLLRRD